MATSILMVCDDQNTKGFNGSDETRSENGKQSGRKKSKSNESTQKKKQPQRGMGVAQLERLRMQEGLKKMTVNNPVHLLPSSFPDPTRTGVPVQLAKYSPYSARNGVGESGLNQALLLQRFGNVGFHGFSGSSGVGGVHTVSHIVDPFGVGASNPSFRVENGIETSRELSSMPNMRFYSERCGVCRKKKRINGENLRCNGVRDMHMDISPINDCNFFGLNLGNNQNIVGESTDFGRRAPGRAGYSGHNVDKEAEVVAVHRKGSSSSSGKESILMEYEFFPGKEYGRSTCHKDLKLGLSEGSAAGEASCFTTTATGVDASNSVDLSLKLSF